MAATIRSFHPPHPVRKNPNALDSDLRKALILAAILMGLFFLWSMSGPRNEETPVPAPPAPVTAPELN